MQIVSDDKPFTITDMAWDKYKINGLVKKWKFDEQDWQSDPLQNYTFSKAYSKKDISIEIAFFTPSDNYYPKKIYQQLIQLG